MQQLKTRINERNNNGSNNNGGNNNNDNSNYNYNRKDTWKSDHKYDFGSDEQNRNPKHKRCSL